MRSYPRDYVNGCRDRFRTQLEAYRRAATSARQPGERRPPPDSPFGRLEPVFFNNMLLALDGCFRDRHRTVERRDGNPLHEVRLLCWSIIHNGETLGTDGGPGLDPATSVLGHREGDPVRLTEEQFVLLADAFFDELERRYVDPAR